MTTQQETEPLTTAQLLALSPIWVAIKTEVPPLPVGH
jgi:hypothetical protein